MKQQNVKKPYAIIKFILIFMVLAVTAIYFMVSQKRKLPVFNPYDVNPKLVDSGIQHIKKGHKIADFNLINQDGKTITQADYTNKIYVANFFFTSCKNICPIMSNNMETVQKEFLNDDTIKILSMSVTPIYDSVPVLKAYAKLHGAIAGKWDLTTGNKKHIYNLARKSYMAVLDEGDGGMQDFIHTEQFMLIDKDRQIRGYYDGTNSDDIKRLIEDVKLLKDE